MNKNTLQWIAIGLAFIALVIISNFLGNLYAVPNYPLGGIR